jgi:4-oxalocrotonate tautomerase
MPFIRITVSGPTLTSEQIQRLQSGTAELMVSVMGKPLDGVATLVERVAEGAWSIAGRPAGVAAHVEATVAEHGNTSEEKARWMTEMWALLRSTLGAALRTESYIVIRETNPHSYGRGGVPRAERDRRSRVEASQGGPRPAGFIG